jgi:hypothetical protein
VQAILKISALSILILICTQMMAQTERNDVFSPIGKYIVKGDADCLSAWFDDNLEVSVASQESNASRAQARQIIKTFFEFYTPQSFDITHTAERANMKYALGNLSAGGETFSVTIFVSAKDEGYKIQQLKIERL